ncbi:ABC transporter ATP-binding protein [Mucilaginibacter sp. UR6-1]|uniref:ABC transporter ATP-binding protein n=1 Tax=Mucilaginibacter sp. UR6-1 TaxID=1435643 RepID=UPI001E3CFDE5|nr:ABC transporter ATP-binding protein [Mucilaginibacter sp. UR6-1]MCC8410255.1 ABC transporter ATP-binding protein [Mucilaginibacter sp. UR6-1]
MLRVDDLDIKFKTSSGFFEAVKGVSFQINKGETLGIVGESGSGKSVTSLALMRLLDRQAKVSGEVFLNGQDVFALSEDAMREVRGNRMAMIFQEPMTSLNPVLTCGFQVAEAIITHLKKTKAEAREAAVALFKEVQLPRPEAIFDSYPHQLSGGQKQRVMIAMALSCNPELLIADEPTTALDVTVQKNIIELLLKLKAERGMSLIFISHDLGVIRQIADRVLVMYKGEVVEHAPIQQLFDAPRNAYTKGLLACRPSPQRLLKKLPTVADFLEAGNELCVNEMCGRYAYEPGELQARRQQLYANEPILKVEGLSKWYPVKSGMFGTSHEVIKAVDEVSFDVYPGETLGLVGESGCGKTTLGRSILKLIAPTHGHVHFEGADLCKLSADQMRRMRRDIQIIFQDPYSSLNPRLTVGQALLEPLQVHRLYTNDTIRRQKIKEVLQRVGLLPEHINRYPHEFSGGQRQRIVIARALVLQPKFIICDESVSALDVSVQAQVLNLLRDLQEEFKLSYIFISHDLAVIKHISDRMMVMNKGRIVEHGFPEDIYLNPQNEYTRRLIDAIPD